MLCWFPGLPQLGLLCPCRLLAAWIAYRDKTWPGAGPLFCVYGAAAAKRVSYETWRKVLSNHFGARDPLALNFFCKGGAAWMKFYALVPKDAVQAQGGGHQLK